MFMLYCFPLVDSLVDFRNQTLLNNKYIGKGNVFFFTNQYYSFIVEAVPITFLPI